MGAVILIARHEMRRRWRGLVELTLLVAVVGAVACASVAGARRTDTALARFNKMSESADVELDAGATPDQIDQLRHVDGVVAVGQLRAYAVLVPSAPELLSIGAAVDDVFGTSVDRDRIVAGRAADPSAADEVAIGEDLAAQLHLGLGDDLDTNSYTTEQVDAILGGASDVGPFAGPNVRLRIVGISRRPLDLGLRGATGGLLVLTPAFDRQYANQIGVFGSRLRVRTKNGAADVPRVQAAARDIFGDSLLATQGLEIETEGARDAINVLALALWIFAAVAAVAGSVAIAFVLTREISLSTRDQPTLRALGFTRPQRMATTAPLVLLVGGVGVLLAALGSVAASPLFPFGVARRADPDVGLHADWTVLALGAAASLVVIFGVAFVAVRRASSGLVADSGSSSRPRTSRVVDGVAAAGLAWQATTLAAIAVVLGIPIGIVVGNLVWHRVATGLGVSTTSTFPIILLLAQIPIVLTLVNLTAFVPARTAARTQPSVALRSE